MAVPTTFREWNQQLDWRAEKPPAKSLVEIKEMSPGDRDFYNDQRYKFLGSDYVIVTSHVREIDKLMASAVRALIGQKSVARTALAISGKAGNGKSTITMDLGRKWDRRWRAQYGDDPNRAYVAYINVDADSTPKMLVERFARFLEVPVPDRLNAPKIMDRVVGAMKERLGTRLVIVDEVHNLVSNREAKEAAVATLKTLSQTVDATFVYCGINLNESALFHGDIGAQIRARTRRYNLTTFSNSTKASREEWGELLLAFEEMLPLADQPERSILAMHSPLYKATGGSIGSLRTLLTEAAYEAIENGTERISLDSLASVLLDVEASDNDAQWVD